MSKQGQAPAAETKPAVEKPAKIEKNGITRPADGTATGKIWAIADKISAHNKAPASRAEVLKAAEAEGINVTTAATQFGRWLKFHGVKATPKPKTEKAPKEKKEKKAKAESGAPAAAPVAAQ